jgi:hypothetical protein
VRCGCGAQAAGSGSQSQNVCGSQETEEQCSHAVCNAAQCVT